MLLGWCVTLTHADLSIKKKIKLENWSSRKVAYRKKNHKRFGYSPSWKWRRCVLYNYRSVKMAFSFSFTAHNYTVLTPLTIRYTIYSTYKTIKNEIWLYYSITYTGCFFFLQQVTALSKSELCIYPTESSKSSLHYTMQQLKTDLPDVLIKVS